MYINYSYQTFKYKVTSFDFEDEKNPKSTILTPMRCLIVGQARSRSYERIILLNIEFAMNIFIYLTFVHIPSNNKFIKNWKKYLIE